MTNSGPIITDHTHYVYVLIDPRTNIPFYVGKGKGRRIYRHVTETVNQTGSNKAKCHIIKQLLDENLQPIYQIQYYPSDKDARVAEKQLISELGRLCDETGPLTNVHVGGNGFGKSGLPVYQYDTLGKFVETYPSASEASDKLNITHSSLTACCRGVWNTAGGYKWSYIKDNSTVMQPYVRENVHNRTPVYQYSMDGRFVAAHTSLSHAATRVGGSKTTGSKISLCCKNLLPSYKGFQWSFTKSTSIDPITPQCKIVEQYNTDGVLIRTFDSIAAASQYTGCTTISRACRGVQSQAGGFIWKYAPINATPHATPRTIEYYKNRASEIHSNKYSYAQWFVLGKYHDKIPITCPDHGIFYQSLANHITCKAGCPGCRQEKRSLGHNKQTVDAWIHRSNTTHHNKYTYVIPECFSNADTDKIDIVCPEHGLFHQTLADHVRKKSGCPTCAKSSRIITNQQKYNRIHPAQRNISSINMSLLSDHTYLKYQHHGLNQTLEQIADSLGVQDTTVGRYFKKFSIPVTRFPASSGEKEVLTFVQSIINTPILVNDRSAIRPQELDVYIPEHNLAIEYCGLYWHSDRIKPDRYHKDKMDACADKNIRLITIFEDEWKTNPTLIQNKIAHILQRQPDKKVFARKCIIKPVTRVEKRQFFNDYHIQGDGPSSIQLGLYYNNQLTACMSFTTQQDGIFILTRYATSTHVVGGFTKLLSTFKVLFEWRKIESFADLRWSCGDLYDRSGFSKEYTIPPDYYWTNGIQRWHKFGFRHKHLPNKLSTYDSALTEAENCYNNGLYKIYDCGKIKYSITNSL